MHTAESNKMHTAGSNKRCFLISFILLLDNKVFLLYKKK